MSGLVYGVGKIVTERDGQCVARATHPGIGYPGEQIHHRKPRRMGGTRTVTTNQPGNLIYLCRACHEWIESHRAKAMEAGWILTDRQVPALTPLRYLGRDVFLDDAGSVRQFVATPWPDQP